MATTLRTGDVGATKARVDAPIDPIVFEKASIGVIGRKDLLAQAVEAVAERPHTAGSVRSSVREWCPRPDSNQHAREGNRF